MIPCGSCPEIYSREVYDMGELEVGIAKLFIHLGSSRYEAGATKIPFFTTKTYQNTPKLQPNKLKTKSDFLRPRLEQKVYRVCSATCPRVKMNASHQMQSHPIKFDFATSGPRNVLMESYGLMIDCFLKLWKLNKLKTFTTDSGPHSFVIVFSLQSNLMLSPIGMCSSGHARTLIALSRVLLLCPKL